MRHTSVAAHEAGGITQHIGAFEVGLPSGHVVTFIDTPGHAAFKAMRDAGAVVTDIVVLVIAMDDGIMPQTLEAYEQSRWVKKIIIAMNKVDRISDPQGRRAVLEQELLQRGIQTEKYGGTIPVVEISALKGTGIQELLEEIVLQAAFLELKARVDSGCAMEAVTLESRIDRGLGLSLNTIVKRGIIRVDQWVVVGEVFGKIKMLKDYKGKLITQAGPSQPVEIIGLGQISTAAGGNISSNIEAGKYVISVPDRSTASEIVENRKYKRSLGLVNSGGRGSSGTYDPNSATEAAAAKVALVTAGTTMVKETLTSMGGSYDERSAVASLAEAEKKVLEQEQLKKGQKKAHHLPGNKNVDAAFAGATVDPRKNSDSNLSNMKVFSMIVRTDVQGTLEAIRFSLASGIKSDEVKAEIVKAECGKPTLTDVELAVTFGCCIVAMNVKVDINVSRLAKQKNVQIQVFKIIYSFMDFVKVEMTKLLPVLYKEEPLGSVEVKAVFNVTRSNHEAAANANLTGSGRRIPVAGGYCIEGKILNSATFFRIYRKKVLIHDNLKLHSLKQFKDEVKTISQGQECGISLEGYQDIQVGDIITAFFQKQIQRTI